MGRFDSKCVLSPSWRWARHESKSTLVKRITSQREGKELSSSEPVYMKSNGNQPWVIRGMGPVSFSFAGSGGFARALGAENVLLFLFRGFEDLLHVSSAVTLRRTLTNLE